MAELWVRFFSLVHECLTSVMEMLAICSGLVISIITEFLNTHFAEKKDSYLYANICSVLCYERFN